MKKREIFAKNLVPAGIFQDELRVKSIANRRRKIDIERSRVVSLHAAIKT